MMKSSRKVVGLSSHLSHIPTFTDLRRSTVTPSACKGPSPGPCLGATCYGLYKLGPGDWNRWKESKEKKDTGDPSLDWNKGTLFAEMHAYISSIKWLLNHYEWNSISCNKKDSPVSKRSLKRLTKGSHWRESKQVTFPMISVLRTAYSSACSCIPVTDKEQRVLQKWRTKEENAPYWFP